MRRSVSGDGARPSASSRARMNLSIGLRGHSARLTCGSSGRFGAMNDQCGVYSAPWAIHCLMRSISSALRLFLDSGGGIISFLLVCVIRRTTSLCSMSPGTIGWTPSRAIKASSRTSRRRSALRGPAAGPWQGKQLLAKTGRISRLKSIFFGRAAIVDSAVSGESPLAGASACSALDDVSAGGTEANSTTAPITAAISSKPPRATYLIVRDIRIFMIRQFARRTSPA